MTTKPQFCYLGSFRNRKNATNAIRQASNTRLPSRLVKEKAEPKTPDVANANGNPVVEAVPKIISRGKFARTKTATISNSSQQAASDLNIVGIWVQPDMRLRCYARTIL